jgi:hypothetical protein
MSPGNDWQNKTFSVATYSVVHTNCEKCHKDLFEVIYKHNGKIICHDCFTKIPAKTTDFSEANFMTNKDRLYCFTDIHTTGKPIKFESKRQWQRHIKSLGLTDNFQQSRTKQEIMNSFEKKRQFKTTPREEIVREVRSELKSKGLNGKLLKRR